MNESEAKLLFTARLDPQLTLGEGATPCLPSRLGRHLRSAEIFLKLEFRNPFGSMLDRGVVASTVWAHRSRRSLVVTTDASLATPLAAYAARAGLPCLALLSADTPVGAVSRARRQGARVWRIAAERPTILAALRDRCAEYGACLVEREEAAFRAGLQTLADELADILAAPRALVVLPPSDGVLDAALAGRLQAQRPNSLPPVTVVTAAAANSADRPLASDVVGADGPVVDARDVETAARLALSEEGLLLGPRSATALALALRLGRAVPTSPMVPHRLVVVLDGDDSLTPPFDCTAVESTEPVIELDAALALARGPF